MQNSAYELTTEVERIDVMVLLDLLGNGLDETHIHNYYADDTGMLFQQMRDIESRLLSLKLLS